MTALTGTASLLQAARDDDGIGVVVRVRTDEFTFGRSPAEDLLLVSEAFADDLTAAAAGTLTARLHGLPPEYTARLIAGLGNTGVVADVAVLAHALRYESVDVPSNLDVESDEWFSNSSAVTEVFEVLQQRTLPIALVFYSDEYEMIKNLPRADVAPRIAVKARANVDWLDDLWGSVLSDPAWLIRPCAAPMLRAFRLHNPGSFSAMALEVRNSVHQPVDLETAVEAALVVVHNGDDAWALDSLIARMLQGERALDVLTEHVWVDLLHACTTMPCPLPETNAALTHDGSTLRAVVSRLAVEPAQWRNVVHLEAYLPREGRSLSPAVVALLLRSARRCDAARMFVRVMAPTQDGASPIPEVRRLLGLPRKPADWESRSVEDLDWLRAQLEPGR